jgi:hypothetical protein
VEKRNLEPVFCGNFPMAFAVVGFFNIPTVIEL